MLHTEIRTKVAGLSNWLAAGRSGIERLAYVLHRITGLGMLFYLLLHIVMTSLRVKRIYLWEEPYIFEEPFFRVCEFLVFAAFAYHAFNGIRLLLVDVGVPVGRPVQTGAGPAAQQILRPVLLLIMLLALVFLVAGGYAFLTAPPEIEP